MLSLRLDPYVRVLVAFALVLSVVAIPSAPPVQANVASAPLHSAEVTQSKQLTQSDHSVIIPVITPTATATIASTPIPIATPIPIVTPPLTTTEMLVNSAGGHLASFDNRIQLDVPSGLFVQPARVRITPHAIVSATWMAAPRIEFDLDAINTGTNAAISTFNQPLTLTVNVTGLIDLEHVPANMYVALYTLSPEGYQMPVWPIQINARAGTISAQVNHFSSWGAGLYPGTPGVWEFNYTAPEVSMYSGAATAQIPLQVPAGRSKLQPNLGLSYNSATLNGVSGSVLGSVDWTRGGALGGFWELDGIPKIAREKWEGCHWKYTPGGGEPVEFWQTCIRDVFTLIIDGTGYELEPVTPAAQQDAILNVPTRYYAVGAPNLYIERHTDCSQYDTKDGECTLNGGNGGSPVNETKEYWLVRTADGTEVRLGYNADSEQVADGVCNPYWWGEEKCRILGTVYVYGMGYKGRAAPNPEDGVGSTYKAARAWWADQITDQFGNTMIFTYGTFWFDNGERVTPRTIKYNSYGTDYLTRIELVGTDTNPPNNEPTIDSIIMSTTNSSGVMATVRRYQFGRSWYTHEKFMRSCDDVPPPEPPEPGVNCGNIPSSFEVLSSIQEQTQDGAGNWFSLPAQTFTYEWRMTRDAYDIMQLIQVNNGYGGLTTFDYIDDMRPYGGYCTWAGCNDHIVSSRRVSTGVGNPDLYATYDYGQACYDAFHAGQASACASRATILCGNSCDYDRFIKLSGFSVVTQTQWDGATAASRGVHYFQNANPGWRKGRELQTQQLDPANNNAVLTNEETTFSDRLNGAWFGFVSEKTSTTYSGGVAASTRTSYAVDSYNDVVSEYQYGAEERVINAGFERTLNGDWVPSQNFTASVTSAAAFAGQNSLLLQSGNNGYVAQAVTGLQPNASYQFRARAFGTLTGTAQVQIYATTAEGGWFNGTTATPVSTAWTPLTVTFTTGNSGIAYLAFYYYAGNGSAIYIDEAALARSADVGDERSVQRAYGHNTATNEWIIGKVTRESVYEGVRPDDGNTQYMKSRNRYRYDYACPFNLNAVPTQGLVTAIDQWNGLSGYSDNCTQIPINPAFDSSYTNYDNWGNPVTMIDPRRNYTYAWYDDGLYQLYPLYVTNAKGQSTQFQFYGINGVPTDGNPIGALKKTIDPNYAETTYTYDTFGRLLNVARPYDTPSLPTTWYTYYDFEQPLRIVEARREVSGQGGNLPIVYFYDGLGRMIQQRTETQDNAQQTVTNVVYDGLGRKKHEYLPAFESFSWTFSRPSGWDTRAKTQTLYNALSRPITLTAPDGTLTVHHYANYVDNGATIAYDDVLDANRHRKQYRSDAYGRLVTALELTGNCSSSGTWGYTCGGAYTTPWAVYGTTRYAYDTLNNLKVVTDVLNNTTTINYDPLSRKTSMTDPDMGVWDYQYDATGNLTVQDDANHQRTCFYYDPLNRLSGKYYTTDTTACATSNPPNIVSYGYDEAGHGSGIGQRTSMTDPSGSASWTYDLRGRMTQQTKVINGTGGGTFVTQWNYNTMDLPTWMKYPGGNAGQIGEQVNFTYNAASWLNSVTGSAPAPYVQSTDYDASGRVELRVLGNNTLRQDYVYFPWTTLNGNGRLQQIKTGTTGDATSLQNLNYTYDAVGNVLTIQDYKAGSPQTQSFHYDSLDRLSDAQATGGTGGTYSLEQYQVNPIGNLTSKAGVTQWYSDTLHKHAVTHINTVRKFWYDANGNMTTRTEGSATYTQYWDQENRITSVTGSASANFVYDGDGNRVKATLSGVTTAYVGSYYEQTGSAYKKYYYAGSTRVAMSDNGTVYYLLGDHLGSTSITANSSGGLSAELRYKPWGENRYTYGTTPTRHQFTGQITDTEIGLYFYNARYYSPAIGRFISADTIVPDGKNPQQFNRYAYTNNNPVKYIDPSGHVVTCSEGPDMVGGCGNDNHFVPGQTQDIANGERQFYINCAKGGGPECNTLHDVENILKGAGIVFAGLAAGMGAPAVADGLGTLGARATVACYYNALCATLFGLGGAGGAAAASNIENESQATSPMGETLYRFSEPSGEMVHSLKSGEEALSLARAADFGSPAEAFESMFGHPPGPNDLYQMTNVGTAIQNGFYPVYDSLQEGLPFGHVSLYGNTWGKIAKAIFDYFGGPKSVVK